jgi:Tfp pilus assembly protein PilO
MDKQSLVKKLLGKKEAKDYSYAFLFLVISSFFAVFAIKPALSIAFSLKREAADLDHINVLYENNLTKLVDVQTSLEKVRDKTYLLDLAAPKMPETKTLIDDIKQSASSEGILISKLSLSDVDLKNESKSQDLKKISINMETKSNFTAVNKFIHKITDQKRIKTVRSLKILSDEAVASGSSQLRIVMEIEGFYL